MTWNPKNLVLQCQGCQSFPWQLFEYTSMADEENISADQYVWENEGTLNRDNGHFLCTDCYVKAGMPTSSGEGWKCP